MLPSNCSRRSYCWREARFLPGCEKCEDHEGRELAQITADLIAVIHQRNFDTQIAEAAASVDAYLQEKYFDG